MLKCKDYDWMEGVVVVKFYHLPKKGTHRMPIVYVCTKM